MRERIDVWWRTFATGVCFLGFGVGGVALGFFVLPPLRWIDRRRGRPGQLAKLCLHHVFRLFIGIMRGVGVLSYDTHGVERLERDGLLVLANHPSLIDVVFLIALIRRADCLVKSALRENFVTAGPVQAAGYICNDASLDVIEQCIASVRANNSLVIFPEGTRSAQAPIQLLRGAAHVAVRGRFDITPVRIVCTPQVLKRGDRWCDVPKKRPHFDIRVGEDIAIAPFVAHAANARCAALELTHFLTRYFREAV